MLEEDDYVGILSAGPVGHRQIAFTLGEPVVERVGARSDRGRNVRLIGESRRKDDRLDARTLARLARIDPQLLAPVKHRSAKAQADLTVIRARAGLVRALTVCLILLHP